jgi:spermidine synthase
VLAAVLALIGFTAVVAQTVFLRELLVVFQGNETTIAIALAAWLAWTALGSGAAGRKRTADPWRRLIRLEILSGLALPATVFAIRSLRAALRVVPGETLSPSLALLAALATLGVFCVLSGALFATGIRAWSAEQDAATSIAGGKVYLLEAVGALAGGLVTGLVLAGRFDSMEIALTGGGLNLLAAAVLLMRRGDRKRAIPVIGLTIVFAFAAPMLTRASLYEMWRGLPLVASENSPYANLAVVGSAGSRTLYENGLASASGGDVASAEESVHFALLQHAAPSSLLVIGGTIGGGIVEALKHPSLERIDCVELDPAVLRVAARYFAQEWLAIEGNRRVFVHSADARLWLKSTERKFDVIIVNLPDPQTAQLNRFYTLEFFREAARRLTPTGVFSFRLAGGENYISPQRGAFLRCINRTLRQAFLQVMAYPGASAHFFATNRRAPLVAAPQQLVARLKARQLTTQYVSEFDIPFRLTEDRVLQLGLAIRPRAATPVNRDFAPVAYYFNAILWSAQFRDRARGLLEALASVRFETMAIALGAIVSLVALLAARRRNAQCAVAGFAAASMGFTMMGLELLVLLGYQAVYGVVYKQLAVVIGAFMGGMALGSWRALKIERAHERALAYAGWMAVGAAVAMVAAMAALARAENAMGFFLGSQILFPALAALAGMLGGWQFPVASRVYFARTDASGGAGALYALDLLGACAGALSIGAWLIPVYGFFRTAVLITIVNLPPALLACWWARRGGQSTVGI